MLNRREYSKNQTYNAKIQNICLQKYAFSLKMDKNNKQKPRHPHGDALALYINRYNIKFPLPSS